MPLATPENEDHPTSPVVPNLQISPTPYVTQVIDTRKEGFDGIATFAAGSRWAVDYYSQQIGRDSAPTSFQSDLPQVYGQYKLIRGLELVVQSPLSYQQADSGAKGWSGTGGGLIYSIVTPNVGDVFVADIGSGQNALVVITSVKASSIYPESMTQVDYRVQTMMVNAIADALAARVVQTVFFSRENLRNGLKALLTTDDVDHGRRLASARDRLTSLYLRDFFSDSFKTLLVPDQVSPTYDPNLVDYVKATFDVDLNPHLRNITTFNMGSDVFTDQQSLFDVILAKDPELLFSCSRKAGIACIQSYRTRPMLRSVYYSGVRQIVALSDVHYNVNSAGRLPEVVGVYAPSQPRQTDVRSLLPVTDLTGDVSESRLWIKPVLEDDCYVLSQAFYDESAGTSILEQMLLDRLRGKPLNLQDLADLADKAHRFDNLERFYYIPLILTLIKLAPGVM